MSEAKKKALEALRAVDEHILSWGQLGKLKEIVHSAIDALEAEGGDSITVQSVAMPGVWLDRAVSPPFPTEEQVEWAVDAFSFAPTQDPHESMRAALAAVLPDAEGWRYRHKKTGGTYKVLLADNVRCEWDLTPAIVYQSEHDGSIWIRPYSEFHDGRFEPLPAPPKEKADE